MWERARWDYEGFVAEHGRQPRQNKGSQLERGLGKWARLQRLRHRGERPPPLSAEQVELLGKIAGWQWFSSSSSL